MDQIKVGRFIAECRKKNGLTQMQLAEKLNITDRAVSKWENGRAMPDSSIMLKLCEILGISVNELLSGEAIKMDNYILKAEENLIELKKQKEDSDRRMLRVEVFIGYISSITLLVLVFVASFIEMPSAIRILLILIGCIIFGLGMISAIVIEQTAGYYECDICHHKYIPSFKSVFLSMHYGRTRYMKCPKCHKRSWCKKVINK